MSPTSEMPTKHIPYARVDLAKKAYERQKKKELEKRWRLNSSTLITQLPYVPMSLVSYKNLMIVELS